MTFSGPFPKALDAIRAAENEGFAAEIAVPMYAAEAMDSAFVRLSDVTLDPDENDEWSQRAMANAQAVMEPYGFTMRGVGRAPTGTAYRLE